MICAVQGQPVAARKLVMGAGVSTKGAPLSEVEIKNEIGVLYDANAKHAFDAAAT